MKKTLKSIPKELSSEQFKMYLAMQLEKALKNKYRPRRPKAKPKAEPKRPKRKRRPARKPVGAAAVAVTEPGAGPLLKHDIPEEEDKRNASQRYMQEELKKAQTEQVIQQMTMLKRAREALQRESERQPSKPKEIKESKRPESKELIISKPDASEYDVEMIGLPPAVPFTPPHVTVVSAPSTPSKAAPSTGTPGLRIPEDINRFTRGELNDFLIRSADEIFRDAVAKVDASYYGEQTLRNMAKQAVSKGKITQDTINKVYSDMKLSPKDAPQVDELHNTDYEGLDSDILFDVLNYEPATNVFRDDILKEFRKRYHAFASKHGRYSDAAQLNSHVDGVVNAKKLELRGAGRSKKSPNDMLSNLEIDMLMKNVPEYAGTFARDNIVAAKLSKTSPTCWIMNTDPVGEPGQHWVAVFIDPLGSQSVEYYDPFGEPCPDDVFVDLARMIPTISPDKMLKFKENLAVNQSDQSNNCGYFCMKFLLHRLAGKPWKFATGFMDLREAEIERFKRLHPMFRGFIKFV